MTKTAIYLLSAMACCGATLNSPSCSYFDVTNTIAHANQGDTVQLPAGTNGWTDTVVVSGITLAGAGTNATLVTDETPLSGGAFYGGGRPMMIVTTVSNSLTRVTGMRFDAGATNNISTFPFNSGGNIEIFGTAPKWRIDHCLFTLLSGKSILQAGDTYGLVDQNSFHTYNRISVQIFGTGYGDSAWASAITLGSSNATYIERNTVTDDNSFGWVDVSQGGRVVFRYNNCEGFFFNTHGPETGGRERGSRYVEVYGNNLLNSRLVAGGQYKDNYTGVDIRGGCAIVFSNVFSAVNAGVIIRDYRATDNSPYYQPWWGATGLTNWDNNGPQLLAGTAMGITNSAILTVTNASWTPGQWVGCTVFNYRNSLCGVVNGNTATTMTFDANGQTLYLISFKDNDQFTIHQIYPMLDGCGVGQGGLLTGDNPTPVNLGQTAQPIYNWNNIVYRNYDVLTLISSNIVNNSETIIAGRQYSNSPAPGYVPFTFPFPTDTTAPVIPNSFSFGAFKL